MSYEPKTVFGNYFWGKNRHDSAFRPSPGMIRGAKIKILAKLKFTQPQNFPGGLGESKNDLRKNSKNAKIDQNSGDGGSPSNP